MPSIISVILLLVFIFLLIFQSQSITLTYNKNHSTITVFTPSQQPLELQIDYTSSEIHLANLYENELDFVYLSKHNKNKLLLNSHKNHNRNKKDQKQINHILFDYQQKQVQLIDGQVIKLSGKIGLKPQQNNLFLQLLRSSSHKKFIRLDYIVQKQTFELVNKQCQNVLKLPISAQLFYEGKQRTVLIRQLNEKLIIDKSIMGFLFKQKNIGVIATIAAEEIQGKEMQVIINNKQRKIQLTELVKPFCHKKGGHTNNNYACDFRHVQKKTALISGGLLMLFDFSICPGGGVQILSINSKQSDQTYYLLHCVLIFCVVIACLIYCYDDFVAIGIKRLLMKNKTY